MRKKNSVILHGIATLLSIMLCASVATPSFAGSDNLIENGGYRAYLEYYCDGSTTAGIKRKTLIDVYLNKGETLYLGSSVHDSQLNEDDVLTNKNTKSDIVLVKPDDSKQSFDVIKNGVGNISDVAQEQAGPNISGNNKDGYTPLEYKAEYTGIYQIRYHSKTGKNANPEPVLVTQEWKESTSTVAAWNATVIGTDGLLKKGRTFTKCLALNMGNNTCKSKNVKLNSIVYVVTNDGYIYKTDFNGMNPFGFIFFGNNRGLVSVSDNKSLYKSFVSNNNEVSDLTNQGATYQDPWNPDTTLDKTFNIFFDHPDPELEGVLYPTAYEPEMATDLTFIGTHGDNHTHVGYGGYFKFKITNSTYATITIDLSKVPLKDGTTKDFGTVQLSGPVVYGSNSFYWNGKGANGEIIPEGYYEGKSIKVTVDTRSGEYHFPLIDVEKAPNGVKVSRINKIYRPAIDENGNVYNQDVTSKYDDKKNYIYYDNKTRENMLSKYHNGANIIADGLNCINGIDSTDGAIKFDSKDGLPMGDQTVLDMWTFSNNSIPLVVPLNTPIYIDDDKQCSLTGRVFYDNVCKSVDATDNYLNINQGDYMIADAKVELHYSFKDMKGNVLTNTVQTTTDATGTYHFFGIPVMENGNLTNCIIKIIRPLKNYRVTTEKTSTNSITNGTEIENIAIGGLKDEILNYKPEIFMSDVGYNYKLITKSLVVKKDWVTNITSNSERPESVNLTVHSYYLDSDNKKVEVEKYEYILNNSNHWSTTITDLPSYYDLEATKQLYYEIISETYSLKDKTEVYTYNSGDSWDQYPYNTSFGTEETIYSTILTATNAPKKGSIQITKRDEDNTGILLENVPFLLFKKTSLTEMPDSEEFKYIKNDNIIYEMIQQAVTNKNGVIVFSDLDIGTYYYIENGIIPGYELEHTLREASITESNRNVSYTVHNKRLSSKLSVIKTVDKAIKGQTVPITVEYSDYDNFEESIKKEYSVEIKDNQLEYAVCNDVVLPTKSFIRITEGTSVYIIDPKSSSVTDDTASAVIDGEYNSNEVFRAVDGHSYTVRLKNIQNPKLTFNMIVNKKDGDTGKGLIKAEFSLYSDNDCTQLIDSKFTEFDKKQEAIATFNNLIPGTYYLKETKSPSGYLLPKDYKIITIDYDGNVSIDFIPVNVESNTFSITIQNFLKVAIPQSGSYITSYGFVLIGLGVCLVAILLLITRRRHVSNI